MEHELFIDLMQHIRDILPGRDPVQYEWVMWVNVVELLEQSCMHEEGKAVTFQRICQRFAGHGGGAFFWEKTRESHPKHQEYLDARKRYLFYDGWDQMGTCWCGIIRNMDWTRLQELLNWLYRFRKEVFPVVKEIVEEQTDYLWPNDVPPVQLLEKQRKQFGSAKSALRHSYDRLDEAGAVILMIQTPEEYIDEKIP